MNLLKEIWSSRALILKLAKNDFKTRYAGSYLGIIWAFIQPIVTILVYWFVFSVGFKPEPIVRDGITWPFVLYLVTGIVPWFFFQDALNGGTNALIEYSYLVKKVVFKISILPVVKLISAMLVHMAFLAFALILSACFGYYPNFYTLQVIYYSICVFMLSLGITYLTSAIVMFFRDLTQIISIVLQIGIWLTPIMWQLGILDEKYHWIFKLNPVYYVVNGYRDSILGNVGIWEHPWQTLYFWAWVLVMLVFGSTVFRKLKVHFADVI